MCYSIIYYIWKPWAPFDLSPIPTQLFDARGADPLFWGSIAGVAAITALAFRFRRSVPALACLWLSYVALILPVSGLMDRPYFPVDRYAHLSSLVLAVGLAFLGRRGFAGVSSKGFGIVVALFVLAFVSVTRRQLGVWRNAAVLGEWNLAHARHPEVVVDNLAKRAVDDEHWGRSAAADERLQSAERQFPAHPRLQAARATIEAERRRRTELDIPLAATVHFDLALRRFRQGRLRDAEDHFRASLVIAPDSPVLRYNFAMSLALVGDGRLALAHYGWLPAGRISTEQRSRLLDVIAAAADTAGETRLATAARRVAAELR